MNEIVQTDLDSEAIEYGAIHATTSPVVGCCSQLGDLMAQLLMPEALQKDEIDAVSAALVKVRKVVLETSRDPYNLYSPVKSTEEAPGKSSSAMITPVPQKPRPLCHVRCGRSSTFPQSTIITSPILLCTENVHTE